MMKSKIFYLILNSLFSFGSQGQGTFIYDQQSSLDETPIRGGGSIQQGSPNIGQSFTPSLAGIDFIRLKVSDANLTNGIGATLLINLRTNAVNGTILGSTIPVTLENAFSGTANFFFQNSVPLTPGATYFFQPVVVSGDLWDVDAYEYRYPGGIAYYQGIGLSGADFWFREGIYIPEPSCGSLLLIGASLVFYFRRVRTSK
jgi:hypothetical protein